jgi:hypothetical protein
MQKKPASSKACSAIDLPDPEMPVISTISRVPPVCASPEGAPGTSSSKPELMDFP